MTKLSDELRTYAFSYAQTKARIDAETAIMRTKSFSGEICPQCWIEDGNERALSTHPNLTKGDNGIVYMCEECGFILP